MNTDIQKIYAQFTQWISKFTFKNEKLSEILFISILIRGSILIEDLPGTWKTTLSKALAKLINYDFKRIQWTSDLTPQDILWGEFYDFESKNIVIRKGAIFTQLLLIDEINRMNPKTQSAFLQAMEEKKVSIMWVEYELDDGFFVIATQNPIEYTGTFPLPEAQKDRFTTKVSIWVPNDELQLSIITKNTPVTLSESIGELGTVISSEEIQYHEVKISEVLVSDTLAKRFIKFFKLLWDSSKLMYPLSQRWVATFVQWCRARAYIMWRDYVIPEDGRELLDSFLSHRLDIMWESLEPVEELYDTSFKNFRV